jgi:hypothetical protein
VAKELTAAGAVPLEEGAAWARARGVRSLAVDLADLDPDFTGLVSLRASGADPTS